MSPRFRVFKSEVRAALQSSDWEGYQKTLEAMPPREQVGALLACLPFGGEATTRAARALGRAVSRIADESMEDARNIVRRFMWHMNEESGNIGWGIPEAFAESLIQCPRLAEAFYPVLFSYITQTGHEDNFCDHDILRRSCYQAVMQLAVARPDLAPKARPLLQAGLLDVDPDCRALARTGLTAIGLF